MSVPSARDINPIPEDLDGQYAEEHFLGKTVTEALSLFEDHFLLALEDLTFMGVVAFRYYVPAAIEYAESGDARHDCGVASALIGTLSHRWHYDKSDLGELRDCFRGYCQRLLERIGEMNFEFPADYRLERKVRRFLDKLDED